MNYKFLYFLAAVLLCMTSCKKEEKFTLLNVAVEGSGNQKVFLNDSNYVFWSGRESIKVNGTTVVVDEEKKVNVPEADEYYAVYPANGNTATSTGGSVVIPKVQYYETYETANGSLKQRLEAPMAASLRGHGDLYLRNLASLVKVVVKNKTAAQVQLHNITLSCDAAYLSGTYNYSFSNSYDTQCEEGIPSGSISNGDHAVILYVPDTSNASIMNAGDSMTFYLVVAPFTEVQGKFRAIVTTTDVSRVVTYTKTNTASALNLKRSCIGVVHTETEKPDTLVGGVFSVSLTKKVTFAPGNTYKDNSNAGHLYGNQYTYDGSTSKDYLSSTDAAGSLSYTDAATGRTFTNDFWELLTDAEWDFLLNQRESNGLLTNSEIGNIGSIAAIVNGVSGVVLVPDLMLDQNAFRVISSNLATANYNSRKVDGANWTIMEAAGCVFLPSNGKNNQASTRNYYVRGTGSNPKYALQTAPDHNANDVCTLIGSQSNYLVRFAKTININFHDN